MNHSNNRVRKMARPPEAKDEVPSEQPAGVAAGTEAETDIMPDTPFAAPALPTTKSASVVVLLWRNQGATLQDIVDATAWQPHTARAFLTGLRKKGYAITRDKVDGVTRYSIPPEAGE